MSRPGAFAGFAALLVAFFAGAGAPTPLYVVYQERYGFSSVVLTLVFAVYVVALLAALVVAGRVSDHAGRRRVLQVALALQLTAMALFLLAAGTGWLLVARAVQGVATGLATAALSAALLDTAPRPDRGAVVAAAAPLGGLAGGALAAGLLVDLGPDPRHLVFWLLGGIYALGLAATLRLPEPLTPDGRWRQSLRPAVAVPARIRPTFAVLAPCMAATWALGGFYLSLGPSLTALVTGTASHVVGALAVVALMGTGALTTVLAREQPAARLMLGGAGLLIAGVLVSLAGAAAESTALLFAGSTIAGLGFGPCFVGVLRVLTADVADHERAGLMAAVYVVSYTAFSVPAILAGVAETQAGLRPTTFAYGGVVVVLAAAAIVAFARRSRRPATA